MNLQAFRRVLVDVEAFSPQCVLDAFKFTSERHFVVFLEPSRCEYAKREESQTSPILSDRNIDVCSIDVMAVGREDIADLVAARAIECGKQANPHCPEERAGDTEPGASRLVAAGDDQANGSGKPALDGVQALPGRFVDANPSRWPAWNDFQPLVNPFVQRKHLCFLA